MTPEWFERGADRPGAAEVASRAARLHREQTGRGPALVAVAPGRVNLIGEHVDYAGGVVLPMAIDRWTAAALSPTDGRHWSLSSESMGQAVRFDAGVVLDAARLRARLPAWAMYAAGVIEHVGRVAEHRGSGRGGAAEVTIASSVPLGAGLSSSASLEAAVGAAVAAGWRLEVSARELARIGRRAEHEFAGAPCGIMDQLAVTAARPGHALRIDCRDESVAPVVLPAGLAVGVIDSGVRHAVPDGTYARLVAAAARAAEALGVSSLREVEAERVESARDRLDAGALAMARHVVSERARVESFLAALAKGDVAGAGRWLAESHASLRDGLGVSCPEVDRLVERVREEPGVVGARMTGAGFGGCVVVVGDAAGIARSVASAPAGARIAARVRPVAGAAVERA